MPIPCALNGCAPERTPTVNVTQVTITGLGAPQTDVFVIAAGSVGQNAVTTTLVPVAGALFAVYRGGLRQAPTQDYVLTGTTTKTVTFSNVAFALGDTILIDYFA